MSAVAKILHGMPPAGVLVPSVHSPRWSTIVSGVSSFHWGTRRGCPSGRTRLILRKCFPCASEGKMVRVNPSIGTEVRTSPFPWITNSRANRASPRRHAAAIRLRTLPRRWESCKIHLVVKVEKTEQIIYIPRVEKHMVQTTVTVALIPSACCAVRRHIMQRQ